MRWAAKDGASAIFHQYEVGDVDGKLAGRIKRVLYLETRLKTAFFGCFNRCFGCTKLGAFRQKLCRCLIVLSNGHGERMVGGNGKEGCAIKCVGACREHFDGRHLSNGARCQVEFDAGTL